jgi:transcriptional regulator with XRE-family HTH domain
VDQLFASLVNEGFGLRLSQARRLRRISQAELGAKIGLSRASIANLENGNQGVLLHHVFACAQSLDVDVKELLPSGAEIAISASASDEAFVELSKAQLSSLLGDDDDENA